MLLRVSNISGSVHLAPPGAGLPAVELATVRILFFLARGVISREKANQRFRTEAEKLLQLVGQLPVERASQPVLIPRIAGIEDSSRNWSALMTLDHLVIVNPAIATIMEHLVANKTFGKKILTQDVKPPLEQTPETIERFRITTKEYLERVNRLSDLKTKTTHDHPWFGPLNAHGWHCLAAIHQRIHRRQMEQILQHANDR